MLKLENEYLSGELVPGVIIEWRPVRFEDLDAARDTPEIVALSQERWGLVGENNTPSDPATRDELIRLGLRQDRLMNTEIIVRVIVGWIGILGDDDAPLPHTRENIAALLSRPRYYNRLVSLIIDESEVKKAELEKNA